jgi:thioredoxin 1
MPIFNTPITTDTNNLDRVMAQPLPVVLYLFDKPNKPLDDAFAQIAREYAGALLVARVNVAEHPAVHHRFGQPALPALLTLDEGVIESQAESIRPADVGDHAAFLLGEGPLPLETTVQAEARTASGRAPIHVTDQTFVQEVLQSPTPVLVDFWAPWCAPCHMIAPSLEALAQQYAGRVKIAKLNVDQNPQMARQYQAMSIPLLVLFNQGLIINRLVGAHPQPMIERLIRSALP